MNRCLLAWTIACLAVPALASGASAGGSTFASGELSCVGVGLAKPQVVEATMSHPGDHYTQTEIAEFRLRELSAQCQERFRVRPPRFQFQVQDHLNHAHWFPINPFRPLWPSPRRHGNLFAHWGIQRGHGVKQPMAPRRLYQCSPGKAITQVRVLLKQTVLNLSTDAVAGSRTIAVAVKVLPVRVPLKHRGALKGPC